MRIALFLLGLLLAAHGQAEPDTFGLGTGRNDRLRIETAGVVLNRYALLTTDAAAGASELRVSDSTVFTVGALVLVHQSTGLSPAPASGLQAGIDLSGNPVGRFEYARVASLTPGVLRLTAPLLYGHVARLSQVVSVPEFVELEVRSGASLRAAPWDGSVGGILAVLVTGRLRNDGLISVDGAGFRGGAFLSHATLTGCTGLEEPVASGGSYKGEGLVGEFGTASGRGNLANGGGGGNCHNAGGGGGGHAGRGGTGGRSAPMDGERDVGGLGGAPLLYQPHERLLFGGGGGAGEGNNEEGTGGGAGGGLMLIRAGEVRGVGRFRAAGGTPPPTAGDDGAGGGGAGGAISLRAAGELECGAVEAPGGAGGDMTETTFPLGPGGGGGGGVVFLQGSRIQCASSVLAGAPGRVATDGGTHGAGPETVEGAISTGSTRVVSRAFRMPGAPVVTLPADGTHQVGPRPRIEGRAEPGVEHVLLFLDGALLTRVVPDAEGRFAYDVPSELSPGSYELRAAAELLGVHSAGSEASRFVVSPLPPEPGSLPPELEPLVLQVGCGCGSAPGVGLWAGTLLLAAWAARRRSRSR